MRYFLFSVVSVALFVSTSYMYIPVMLTVEVCELQVSECVCVCVENYDLCMYGRES